MRDCAYFQFFVGCFRRFGQIILLNRFSHRQTRVRDINTKCRCALRITHFRVKVYLCTGCNYIGWCQCIGDRVNDEDMDRQAALDRLRVGLSGGWP